MCNEKGVTGSDRVWGQNRASRGWLYLHLFNDFTPRAVVCRLQIYSAADKLFEPGCQAHNLCIISIINALSLSGAGTHPGEHSLCLLMCGAVEQNCHNRNGDNSYEYHHNHIQRSLHYSDKASYYECHGISIWGEQALFMLRGWSDFVRLLIYHHVIHLSAHQINPQKSNQLRHRFAPRCVTAP